MMGIDYEMLDEQHRRAMALIRQHDQLIADLQGQVANLRARVSELEERTITQGPDDPPAILDSGFRDELGYLLTE